MAVLLNGYMSLLTSMYNIKIKYKSLFLHLYFFDYPFIVIIYAITLGTQFGIMYL